MYNRWAFKSSLWDFVGWTPGGLSQLSNQLFVSTWVVIWVQGEVYEIQLCAGLLSCVESTCPSPSPSEPLPREHAQVYSLSK